MSLSAVSFASDPEFVNMTCPKPRGVSEEIFSASAMAGSVVVLKKEQ